jgi:hypothetical protein
MVAHRGHGWVRHQGAQNGTTLHQSPQIPDSGDFLPKFLPKEAVQRSRDVISPGQTRKFRWLTRVWHQPSKLAMRVRFPSPALPAYALFSCICSPNFRLIRPLADTDAHFGALPVQNGVYEQNYVGVTVGLEPFFSTQNAHRRKAGHASLNPAARSATPLPRRLTARGRPLPVFCCLAAAEEAERHDAEARPTWRQWA